MTALIVPPKGEGKATAVALLALADDPNQVATTTDGPDGVSFVVPEDLYDKYMSAGEEVTESVESQVKQPPAPKRRGRPPKKVTEE